MRGQGFVKWQQLEALLEPNLAEHEQLASLDHGSVTRYSQISAKALLVGGRKSPAFIAANLEALHSAIPDSRVTISRG